LSILILNRRLPLLSADDRIVLVRIKVERAKKHLRDLAAEVLAKEGVGVVTRNLDTQGGKGSANTIKFGLTNDAPKIVPCFSADVLAGVGDIAHNLRTALDHLMCHLLLVAGSKITKQDYFPISESFDRYESRKAGIVNRVRPKVIETLDWLKPYKGGNDDLWRVHELDRIDKHRALFTLAHDFVLYADWLDRELLFKRDAPDFAGFYDEQVEQNMQFEIEKSLGQPQVPGRDAVLPSMRQLVDFVDSAILKFKPFLE